MSDPTIPSGTALRLLQIWPPKGAIRDRDRLIVTGRLAVIATAVASPPITCRTSNDPVALRRAVPYDARVHLMRTLLLGLTSVSKLRRLAAGGAAA